MRIITYDDIHLDPQWKVSGITEYRKDGRWHKVIGHTHLSAIPSPELQLIAARNHGADAICVRLRNTTTDLILLLDVPMFKDFLIQEKLSIHNSQTLNS
jgi:hypothetical protein